MIGLLPRVGAHCVAGCNVVVNAVPESRVTRHHTQHASHVITRNTCHTHTPIVKQVGVHFNANGYRAVRVYLLHHHGFTIERKGFRVEKKGV